MIDHIYKETEKQKTFARILLCDFSKAIDLVDHAKLVEQVIPRKGRIGQLNESSRNDSTTKKKT